MLFLVFFFNVVGWEGIKKFFDLPPLTENSKLSREELDRRKDVVDHLTRQFLARAEERIRYGKPYTPYDYFFDLKLITMKEKELEIPEKGNLVLICQLQNFSFQSFNVGYNHNDVEKAKSQYKEFIEPARESREEVYAHLRAMGWGVLNWFWLCISKLYP